MVDVGGQGGKQLRGLAGNVLDEETIRSMM